MDGYEDWESIDGDGVVVTKGRAGPVRKKRGDGKKRKGMAKDLHGLLLDRPLTAEEESICMQVSSRMQV